MGYQLVDLDEEGAKDSREGREDFLEWEVALVIG